MSYALPSRQLSSAELRALTRRYAAEVHEGLHPVQSDPTRRWHVRLHADDDVDVWLISWTREQGTELHDHGGSTGAFTVVEGTLAEYVWSGRRADGPGVLTRQSREAGDTVVFGDRYVHDVRNHDETVAVSVHAYSPPLRRMNYYDAEGGTLLKWADQWTDDPEAPSPARDAS
ncbi:MAG: cysteine dioxygenase family protein [Nocardioides sp.]|uniref:cysteine dioxygenase n=1 Tax=Nocardioides sp. TaxID=35761 RepID=UPI0039E4B6DC